MSSSPLSEGKCDHFQKSPIWLICSCFLPLRSRLDISLAKDSPTRKTSPLKTRYSPEKSSTSLAEKKKEAPLAEAEPEDDEEDDGSFKFAQKKRLKALASKFSNYDDEDSMAIKQLAKVGKS